MTHGRDLVADVHNHNIPEHFIETVRQDRGRHGFSLRSGRDGANALLTPEGTSILLRPDRCRGSVRQRELELLGVDIVLEGVAPWVNVYGVDRSTAAWGTHAMNDALIESVRAFPDRVSAMASVPLQFPDFAVSELERAVEELRMRSVLVFTNVRGANLDAPELDRFWGACEALEVLVFVHPQFVAARDRLSRYHLVNLIGNPLETTIALASLVFGGVLDRHPQLKLCLAHAGGVVPWLRGRLRSGWNLQRRAMSGSATQPIDDYLEQIYFDTIVHDDRALRILDRDSGR